MTHFFLHSATHLLITSPLPCSKACSTVYDDTHTHTYTYTSMLAVSFCNMLGCDKAITVRDCAKRDLLTVCNTVCSNYISAHFYVPRIQDAVNYAAITWWNEKWARLAFFFFFAQNEPLKSMFNCGTWCWLSWRIAHIQQLLRAMLRFNLYLELQQFC